jgi:hypothetical protein
MDDVMGILYTISYRYDVLSYYFLQDEEEGNKNC